MSMIPRFVRLSLLWRILLSTSIAITLLFALTGWLVQSYVVRANWQNLEQEERANLQSYESLWSARAERLASISSILAAMSDVRRAFGARDEATIRDTAKELWALGNREDALFLVTDPPGHVIASLGATGAELPAELDVVPQAAAKFPEQAKGFLFQGGKLYQVVVTPVYVETPRGQALLNVLVAGFAADAALAERLKRQTGGSDFVIRAGNRVMASTLPDAVARGVEWAPASNAGMRQMKIGGSEYAVLTQPLLDVRGRQVGELLLVRSLAAAERRIMDLQRNVFAIWLAVILIGLALTYLLARRIVGPVERLDMAAAEVARSNYACRVPVESQDEMGRLAATFNNMCASLQEARDELIRHERIATIGRLSSSIVHDLRNPLAAIYGGAEMLVDSDLAPAQSRRLAGNIYRASRRIQELLQDLVNISRGKAEEVEQCSLLDIVTAAQEVVTPAADAQGVAIEVEAPGGVELPLERARMERVFLNLMNNALEAMPEGGKLRVSMVQDGEFVTVHVDDTGPGISAAIRSQLFQPFVSAGKKNGLGLGLALSRQTVLDQGGDLWVDETHGPGARFCLRLSRKVHHS